MVSGGNASGFGERRMVAGPMPLPSRYGRSWKLAGQRESGGGVVPCAGTCVGLRYFQQWSSVRGNYRPTGGSLDRAEMGMACRISGGRPYRTRVGIPVAVYLSDASKGRSGGYCSSNSPLDLVSPAVRVEFYSGQDFPRPGLVLLRVLVSRIPQAGSTS